MEGIGLSVQRTRLAWSVPATVLRLALILILAGLVGQPVARGQSTNLSQWVGVFPLTIAPGPNCISPPLTGLTVYRGTVSSLADNIVTVTGTPDWTADQFGPRVVGTNSFSQYLIWRRPDATGAGGGDWWPVTANDATSLTLEPRGDLIASWLTAGDEIEVRRLLSLRDLFDHGNTAVLDHDQNRVGSRYEEDIIRFVHQAEFTQEVFYHDGSLTDGVDGWLVDGAGPCDGSQITLLPGQPIMLFRQDDSTNLTVLVTGQLQNGPWTHRLEPGANAIALPYPTTQPIAVAALLEAGWHADADGSGGNDDHVRKVVGTSFGDEVFYHDGSVTSGTPGWVVNGEPRSDWAFEPAHGYMFFLHRSQPLRWRQPAPYSLP